MVSRRDYERGRRHEKTGGGRGGPYRGGKGPLMFNIRTRYLAHRNEPEPDDEDVINALQVLLDTGQMPERWQFMVCDWQNPDRYTTWSRQNPWASEYSPRYRGDETDLEAFRLAIQSRIHELTVDLVKSRGRRVGRVERE